MQVRASPKDSQSPALKLPKMPGGKWRPLSPRSAGRLFGDSINGGGSGIFGKSLIPGTPPRYSSREKRDPRRLILLNMIYTNIFLALILVVIGWMGPQYPGHSGTTDNAYTDRNNRRSLTTQDSPLYQSDCPTEEVDTANASILHSAFIVGLVIWFTQPCSAHSIYHKVDRRGAAATLLTSVACAFTCIGAFAVVMVDIGYIANCCLLLEDNCEVSNLCTEFVTDCCISDDVKDYCGNPSYHVGAVSMIFLVFLSTSAMMVMSCTMSCRCWSDSDPEKQAMMMVLTGTGSGFSPTSSSGFPPQMYQSLTQPSSPKFAPRKTLLAALGDGKSSPSNSPQSTSPRQSYTLNLRVKTGSPRSTPVTSRWTNSPGAEKMEQGRGSEGSGVGGSGSGAGGGATVTNGKCRQCGAVFGNADTLANHVQRFHPKGRIAITGTDIERIEPPRTSIIRTSLKRKSSVYTPDEGI